MVELINELSLGEGWVTVAFWLTIVGGIVFYYAHKNHLKAKKGESLD